MALLEVRGRPHPEGVEDPDWLGIAATSGRPRRADPARVAHPRRHRRVPAARGQGRRAAEDGARALHRPAGDLRRSPRGRWRASPDRRPWRRRSRNCGARRRVAGAALAGRTRRRRCSARGERARCSSASNRATSRTARVIRSSDRPASCCEALAGRADEAEVYLTTP